MPVLARVWQMLLKGLEEVQAAPAPAQAAQMVLVRLAYVADLPVPADLVRTLTAGQQTAAPSPPPGERVGVRGQNAGAIEVPSPALGLAPSGTLSRIAGEGLASSAAAGYCRTACHTRGAAERRVRTDAAELCRNRRPVRQKARGADPRPSVERMSISSASSPAGSSSAGPRARPTISPTGSASCSANGPARAGSSPSRRPRARRPWPRRRRGGRARCATRSRRTRWCGRCWKPSPAPRSRRCASGSPRPRPGPKRRRRCGDDVSDDGASTGEDGS